jgi:hypothetical protein
MARRTLVNMLRVASTTGLAQVTSNTLTSAGNSMEFYEFSHADAVQFTVDCSAFTGTSITFALNQRDPATGLFYAVSGVTFAAVTGVLATAQVVTVDPLYQSCYQLSWTGTFTSFTGSVVATLTDRS